MKLALGTAQFGLEYGIANQQGRVSRDDVESIVRHARAAGLDTLDTAIAYGDCEQQLGEIGVSDWQIVSKLPAMSDDCRDVADWITGSAQASLRRLRVDRLHGLLLHRPHQLVEPRGAQLYRALEQLRTDGLVAKIGVSIYESSELDALCGPFHFDLIQAPFNLFDRRLIESGWMSRLAARGTELHVRSVFLQGLLLMPRDNRPPGFDRWAPLWKRYEDWLGQAGVTPLQACLRHASSFPEIAKVIVGVDSLRHLTEILEAAEGPAPEGSEALGTDDPDLINPSRWAAPA